jgi:hypothetical protein
LYLPEESSSQIKLEIGAVLSLDHALRNARKVVPVQPVDATPSDKSFLFIGGVYDRRKTG